MYIYIYISVCAWGGIRAGRDPSRTKPIPCRLTDRGGSGASNLGLDWPFGTIGLQRDWYPSVLDWRGIWSH